MGIFTAFLGILGVGIFFGQSYVQSIKAPLVVSTILVEPFVLKGESYNDNGTEVTTYDGYIPDLLEEIKKLTGITFTLVVEDHQTFGSQRKIGNWSGLIGDVISKKCDIAAGPLTPTAARRSVVDFSVPYMNFAHVITMKRPTSSVMNLRERLQRLFSPLSQGIYLMSILAWLVTSAVLYIIAHTNPYEWRRMTKDKEATLREGESFTCINTFWFTMSTLLWQGYIRAPRSVGGRTVTLFWWTYVLLFIAMYISSMTNFLRVGPTQDGISYTDIQSIDDLAGQSRVEYGAIKEGATMQFLKTLKRTSPNLRNLMKFMDKTHVTDIAQGIGKVRDSIKKPYAFIAESAMAQYYARQSPCDIYMVGDFKIFGSYSLAVQLGSNLRPHLDYALLRLQERGVLKRLFDQWFTGECSDFLMDASHTDKVKVPPFIKVDLGSFSGALVILGVGLLLGSLITIVEVIIFKHAETEEKREHDEKRPINEKSGMGDGSDESREPVTDV